MSKTTTPPVEMTPMFQLKGGMYTLTAIQLLGTDLSLFERQLEGKIQQAPKFFQNAPIVIDLQKLKSTQTIKMDHLRALLLNKKLIPIGVRGGTAEQQMAAVGAGLALLQDSSKETSEASKASATTEVAAAAAKIASEEITGTSSKIITSPVRSGQQIYARGGDLIVLSTVSHGAELLADGHIHVYGALKGRALAGVTGDTHAHVFCQSLEAELISIAGQYQISEDIDPNFWQRGVDVSLTAGRLHFRPL